MNCDFTKIEGPNEKGERRFLCDQCGQWTQWLKTDEHFRKCAGKTKPLTGPGTELKAIFAELGIIDNGCDGCGSLQQEMNLNGPQWCRENIPHIRRRIKENAKTAEIDWPTWLKAHAIAASHGWFSLDDLILEAIRRSLESSLAESDVKEM